MPRFAANLTMMFNEHPFPDRFGAAAAAGFSAVEYLFPYDYPVEFIAEKLSEAGLKQALFNLPPGDWARGERGLAALPERKEEFRQSVKKAIDYGRVIGTPLLHMMAGIASPDDPAAQGSYRDAVAFAADSAGAEGIGLVIEPINGRDMPGYFLDDFDRAADIITSLGHPNLKLQFDIYHRQVMRGDVLTALREMMPLIGHVQIASVPGRNEPGTGELNDFKVLQALDQLGYQGYVGCEYRPAGETMAGLGWLKRI
ncbi:2-oxo-tetronate isomerase [Brucella sp. IR073]|uniref:2-oxo-tetronate isomerase n=1 Tax=unclassified Brucella TaxID=2632610 RepID=UPI003B98537E